jgi:two-component SAPR family response regulator
MVNYNNLKRIKICRSTAMLLICIFFSFQQSTAQGLRFNSNDSLINKRTSYNVFQQESPKFNKQLTIAFDLSLWDVEHFGYILNITDNNQNSYSLTYNHTTDQGNLYFNVDGKTNKLKIPLKKDLLVRRNWLAVRLELDLEKDQVDIKINNKHYKASGFGFKAPFLAKIVFGKNDHYTDVPEMAIRNLSVMDNIKTFDFPLDEWKGNSVHDKQGKVIGDVKNPNWLINESYSWRRMWQESFTSPVGLNFDSAKNNFLVYGQKSLLQYNVVTNELKSEPYSTPMPIKLLLGKNTLNQKENSLIAYELDPNHRSGASIARLNLVDRSWKVIGNAKLPEQRHHHNSFYNKQSDELYVFGGYGGFAYHKEFFKYNLQQDSWDKVEFSGDKITPRFFSAASPASKTNQVYIFGGYGNQSGNQVVGGVHYYDLYQVDLTTKQVTKRWSIKPKERAFVPANNLILSADGKYFYALCYPHEDAKTYLRLYRFSILNGHYEIVSDKIPVVSERIESDINLFFDKSSNQFICTIQEFTSPEHSNVQILTLSNPPVTEQMYRQGGIKQILAPSYRMYVWLVLGLIILFTIVWLYIRWLKSPLPIKEHMDKVPIKAETNTTQYVSPAPQVLSNAFHSIEKENNARENANSIYLLGEFSVYDNQATNISAHFSPKLQQLFVLILLNSKAGEGVTSKRISSYLWPEKELSNTKNIKGVTISNLRSILKDVNGIELTFLNDHYRFTINEQVYCDYFWVGDFLKQDNTGSTILAEYLPAMLRGSLLPAMPAPWLDEFKTFFEQSILERLLPEVERAFSEDNLKLTVDLARVILKVDPFNDQALRFQLNAIRRLKGKDAASKYFQQFRVEYETSLGIQYPLSFEEVCH